MTSSSWQVRLSAEALNDFRLIVTYSADKFGRVKAAAYSGLLREALASLEQGPNVPGSAARDEILPDLRSLHVSRKGRRGSHFILYRAVVPGVIEVLRLLHDAMDLRRHLPG